MDILLVPFLNLVYSLLHLLDWVIFLSVILNLLVYFGILNPYNRGISLLFHFLDQVLEPLLAPLRRRLPQWGALDLSPLVLMLALHFLQSMIQQIVLHLMR